MSFPKPTKTRSSVGAVHKVMSTLLQFERKLDKLQDDVSYHGQALNELKTLVFNLSTGTIVNPDGKTDVKRSTSRTKKSTIATAIQYDRAFSFEEPLKIRRKQAVQPLPSKIQAKNIPLRAPVTINKASSPRAVPVKHTHKTLRPSKAEAPRKATTLRTQKGMAVKHSNPIKV